MKILHVIESIAPRYGGPVAVVKGLSTAQARAGHEVTVCTTNRDHPTGILVPAGTSRWADLVTVHAFDVQVDSLCISLRMLSYLRSHIQDFDILHIHGLYRFPSSFAGNLAKRRRVPYVVRPFGSLDPVLHSKSARSIVLKRAYEIAFDRPMLHAAGAIHFTADEERRRVASLGLRAPAFVLANGVDWSAFDVLPARGRWRRALGIGTAPLVVCVGRLHPVKGIELLLAAAVKLRSSFPDINLMVVGASNDSYGRALQKRVETSDQNDYVHFVGHVEGEDLIQAYVDADVFALPSYSENFGMTIAEAMACRIPVVISDQVRIHDHVRRAKAGIVTRCDPAEVAAAIGALLKNPDAAARMGSAGQRLVQTDFTWAQLVPALDEHYRTVINRTRRGAV